MAKQLKKRYSDDWVRNTKNIWFPDQVEPDPNEDYDKFIAYWKKERNRCTNGFRLGDGQVYISGWLYFHTVYWTIELDVKYINPITGVETSNKAPGIATLRDIEWIVSQDLQRVEIEKGIYNLVSCRGIGKSFLAGSFIGQSYFFFDSSENLLTGGNTPDINKLGEKVALGVDNIHPVFQKQRIKNNWKVEVRAGYEDKATGAVKGSNSRILTRNYKDGINSMATNGTRPKRQIIDEQGKIKYLKDCLLNSKPSWMNDFGFFSTVFLTGCVCAGTKIWTHDGKLINIEDLVQSNGIVGYNGSSFSKETISNMNPISKKNCYRITTSANNILECSEDHPLLVSNRNKRTYINGINNVHQYSFKQTKDLQLGDYISRIDEVPIFGIETHNNARLIGLFLADGYFKGNSLSIDDYKIREFITNNYEISIRKEFFTKKGELYSDLYLKGVKKIFDEYKITNLTKEHKRLPDNIHQFDKTSLSEILAGIFDGDGNIYYNSKKQSTRIVLTNISLNLLEDIKYQLLKFGIHSSIYKEKRNIAPSEEYKGQKDHIYRLYIAKDKSIERFKNNIPIIHSKKVETLNTLFKKGNRDYGYHKGIFKLTGEHNDEKFIDNNTFLSGFTFESVTKIEYLGEREIYNLTALENHTYLANGFITHNTGGDMEVGEEAGIVFNNPELYGCLQFDDIWEGQGKIGRFIPTTLGRNEFKEPWTLYDFLKNKYPEEYGNLQPHEELSRVIIMVSNEERCMKEFVIPRRELAMKSTSSNEIISEKAYYPIIPSECFLKLSANDFPIEAAQEHLNKLRKIGFKPVRIELYQDSNGIIKSKFTDKLPVTDFPVNKSSNKEGVIEILEYPIAGSPWGTYVAGMDPYKVSESDYSDSLGAVYIFKRMTTNMTEPYQHMPVAWYVGRPKNIRDWQDNARMLLEFYNAECMCEANDESFIQYMMILNKQNYLARGQASLKEITQDSKFKGLYGLPATTKTIEKWNNSLVIYTKEMLAKLDSEEGEPRVEMGINKILDVMLLEEIIKFNKHSGNFDRVRAMGIALAYANQLDAWLGKTTIEEEYREKTKIIKSPFTLNNISNKQNSQYNRKVNSPFLINKVR